MKCIRKFYLDVVYYYKRHERQYLKSQSPYSRRWRTCARTLERMLTRSTNGMAYYNAWARISHQWPDKKKWQ